VDFKCGHLDLAPLRRFGFQVGDGTRLFGWVRPRLSVGAASPARLLRHLPQKFATRLRRENGLALTAITVRLVTVVQTLQIPIDAYRSTTQR
jgi:hypothetical protein